ncbi:MAG: hypothetical protein DWG83_02295, partial [Chloroflexi bacterium]|nr:hypothetical protein [Chloroflexota bacterium]
AREPLHIYTPAGVEPASRAQDAEWVLYPRGSHTRQRIDEGLARLGIVPRVALESHNPQVLRQMVELGFGWGVLPPTVAGEGVLIQREQVAERFLLGVWRAGRSDDPRVSAFLEVALSATRPG